MKPPCNRANPTYHDISSALHKLNEIFFIVLLWVLLAQPLEYWNG